MESYFVSNGDVIVHVLDNGASGKGARPLLVLGGVWESAERAIPLLSGLGSRALALSFRGRGLSSTPKKGYGLDGHLSDIEAVVRHSGLKEYCVLGFSRGASYALGWSLSNQKDMRGLILVDQPPVHIRPGEGYAEYWANLVYQGVPVINFMRREALDGLERDAEDIDFSSRLGELDIPVALFVGGNKDAAIPSSIDDEALGLYKQRVAHLKIVEFSGSGHMIPDEERQKYVEETASFLKSLNG